MRSLGLRGFGIFVVFSCAPILFAGCASSGNNFNENHVSDIQKGVTTEADLLRMFGEPTNRIVNSDGTENLTWNYGQYESDKRAFIPYAGVFFAGNSSTKHKMLNVTLRNGKVESYTADTGGMDTRQGTQDTPH